MIRNPNDIQDGAKKIRMLIAGYPGIGKSTLALSAPRPLHIDCDFGIDRIEPRYRMPYIQPRSYDEILNDLKPENLNDFETLVFDTAGKLISLMGLWAIKQNPKYGQRDGSLSLKGYGFVGREFVRLMDYCFYELKKNIVVVFHATEEKDGDNTRLRIKVEGQTKNNVWEPMDLGGFVEMYGNDRTIGFSNCEKYFAKGTRGIHGMNPLNFLIGGYKLSAREFQWSSRTPKRQKKPILRSITCTSGLASGLLLPFPWSRAQSLCLPSGILSGISSRPVCCGFLPMCCLHRTTSRKC